MVCKIYNNTRFIGHQIIRADVLVDSAGEFEADLPGGVENHIYDRAMPYGPFTCTCCGAEYDKLTEASDPQQYGKYDPEAGVKNNEDPENMTEETKTEASTSRFSVSVMETLKRTVIVRAKSLVEAVRKVELAVERGEIVLTDRDYHDCEVVPSGDWSGGKVPEDEDVSDLWTI